jgi:hypothetical protein
MDGHDLIQQIVTLGFYPSRASSNGRLTPPRWIEQRSACSGCGGAIAADRGGGARTRLTVDGIRWGFIQLDRGDEENSPSAVLGCEKQRLGLSVVTLSSSQWLLAKAIHGGSPGELRSKRVQGAPMKLLHRRPSSGGSGLPWRRRWLCSGAAMGNLGQGISGACYL